MGNKLKQLLCSHKYIRECVYIPKYTDENTQVTEWRCVSCGKIKYIKK